MPYPEITPRMFSFNNPHGACPVCDGTDVERRPSSKVRVAKAPKAAPPPAPKKKAR
jgi:excinuclease UvrABC ATPase subunit